MNTCNKWDYQIYKNRKSKSNLSNSLVYTSTFQIMNRIEIIQMDQEELKALIREQLYEVIPEIIKEHRKPEKSDQLLTRQETAKLLRISLPTLHQYTKEGRVRGYRFAGRVLYKKNEVVDALNVIRTQLPRSY